MLSSLRIAIEWGLRILSDFVTIKLQASAKIIL